MNFRPKIAIFLLILAILSVFFAFPKLASASSSISTVSPIVFSPGDEITISGNNFADKKGNVYIGSLKYPYYGYSIKLWSNTKIILSTNSNNKIYSGKIGIQSWDSNSNKLGNIVYGPDIFVKASIRNVNPKKVTQGSTVVVSGSSFKSSGNSKPLVYINNVLAEVIFFSDTQIKFLVPANAKSGALRLVFPNSVTVEAGSLSISKKISDKVTLPDQWYLENINANSALETYSGDKNVIVAVIDDGIYLEHPNLKNNIWVNSDENIGDNIDNDKNGYVDDKNGWNFIDDNKDLKSFGTHGTMVAGIIAAYSAEDDFVRGINQNVSLMSLVVSDSYGNVNPLDITRAIHYAVDNGADVINLSLGSSLEVYSSQFDEAITYAYNHNVLIVAAAGNGDLDSGLGLNLDENKVSPVCNDNGQNMILGVGSSDESNKKTTWSNHGSCVDIYAPGMDIISTASPIFTKYNVFYKSASGTSFSTPMVSATAVLIKAKYPNIQAKEIANIIISSAKKINNISLLDVGQSLATDFSAQVSEFDDLGLKAMTLGEKITDSKTLQYIAKEKELLKTIDQPMSARLSGKIVLQVENNGEAWYIFPDNKKKYYLGTAQDAYYIMRKLGLGATHKFITSHQVFPDYVLGKILLDVEKNGEAYYINPVDKRAYYLKSGEDAYNIMRKYGIGISNNNLRKINIGELN